MSVDFARQFFRTEERRLMDSCITVVRDDGDATFDSNTGEYEQPETTVYEGDALIRQNAWEGSDREVADIEVRMRTWRLKVPHDTALFRNDRITVDSSHNPNLVGRKFRITDFYGDDWAPSGQFFCEEVT